LKRAGFTLLEVMVATLIMGVAVTGLIVGLSQSVRNASRLASYDQAAALARSQMNELLLSAQLPFEGEIEGHFLNGFPGEGTANAGWRAVTKPFETQANPIPGSEVLQRIALQVWWEPEGGTRRTLDIAGYRPARIPAAEAGRP
jgi:general secretion pathway protein I